MYRATDVEYSRTGTVIKGQERAKAKSKYEEDGNYMAASFHSWPLLTFVLLRSADQQPHDGMGILVRFGFRNLGFRVLSSYK